MFVLKYSQIDSKFDILQYELLLTKKVNSELYSRLVNMERQCWANAQYSRRECLEVVGIPREVEQKDLESKVLSVLEKVGCKINPDNIEDCHRLSIRVEKDLRNLNLEDLGFHGKIKFI